MENKKVAAIRTRQKAWKPKVKTGCITCRLRRVKCDEEKPGCRRCFSAGRKCDGYRQEPKTSMSLSWENHSWNHSWTPFVMVSDGFRLPHTSPLLPHLLLPPRLVVFDSAEERQSWEFFHSYSVPEITQLFRFDESFWHFSVLQISMTQPAVRHAVNALGALHRKFASGSSTAIPEDTSDAQMRFALEQCNRSITSLSETATSDSRIHKLSTLIACILYTCLASLQGYQSQTIMHFRNGLKLLDNLGHPGSAEKGSEAHYDTQVQSFVSTFTSLETQARSLLCEENLPPWPARTKMRSSLCSRDDIKFRTLSEARDFFETVLNDFQCFVQDRGADGEWAIPGASPRRAVMDEYHMLVKRHAAGVETFESFLARQTDFPDRDKKTILMLKLHGCVMDIYLAIYPLLLQHGEMAWDHLESYYSTVISLSREILGCKEENLSERLSLDTNTGIENADFPVRRNCNAKRPREPEIPSAASILLKGVHQQRPVFTFSQGVIGPLYTVAVQCRSPTLRREAIALLLQYPRREGLWDSHNAGRIAWEVMCLEEATARSIHGGQGDFQVKAASDIPAGCRVGEVEMICTGPRTGRVRLRTAKESERGEQGQFLKILEW